MLLKKKWLTTPLDPMLAIGHDDALYLLEFESGKRLDSKLKSFIATLEEGSCASIDSIEKELNAYFAGSLSQFKTPIKMCGTPFQMKVWQALLEIPHGETRSYKELAMMVGQPTAFRAVANANGRNPLAIIVPCHRVINADGRLGGYGGGIERKQALLNREEE